MKRIRLVFQDGRLLEAESNMEHLPEHIFSQEGQTIFLNLPQNQKLQTPIHLIFLRRAEAPLCLQQQIVVEKNAEVTLIEEHIHENGFLLPTTTEFKIDCKVDSDATFNYFKLQDENRRAIHHADITLTQAQNSRASMFLADCGSQTSTTHANIYLRGKGASCDLKGLYFLNADLQQTTQQWLVEHVAPFSSSNMQFKGILDKKSKALFQGKVYVHEKAEAITAKQANHNLLLSNEAQVETRPQLEIYADEVNCTHGATVGSIDPESIFYLRSRGIEENTALKLLTEAFVADLMGAVTDPLMKRSIQSRLQV